MNASNANPVDDTNPPAGDGPRLLRSIREQMEIPLARVSRISGLSHAHLTKVEQGDPYRPITPAVLAA